jgi:hypothetical protein
MPIFRPSFRVSESTRNRLWKRTPWLNSCHGTLSIATGPLGSSSAVMGIASSTSMGGVRIDRP